MGKLFRPRAMATPLLHWIGWLAPVMGAWLTVAGSRGEVVMLEDRDAWIAVVGAHSTVDFTGIPSGTIVTDQYADLGVIFTDGDDWVLCCSETTFPDDGAGLQSWIEIGLAFDRPQSWIAADFPGSLVIELYDSGELVGEAHALTNGAGNFAGVVSSRPFDAAVLDREAGDPVIDDLYFGPPPCPADLDADALVGVNDFLLLLAAWGTDPGGPPDLDGDGDVGVTDFLVLLATWGPCAHFVDCNGDGVWDLRELWELASSDCNSNAVPDDCDLAEGTSLDCNANTVPDECDLDSGTSQDCNENDIPDECDLADGTSVDCNENGIPDECEVDCDENGIPDECDIADGSLEDLDGNGIPDVCEFPNDDCEDAVEIFIGTTPFSTVGANTDGPPAFCEAGQGTMFVKDVWFLYRAPSTGTSTFSVCNAADFDTRLAVYWAGCPAPVNPLACSVNAPGCGQTSEVQLVVVDHYFYLVRIGGTDGHGTGVLTVTHVPAAEPPSPPK